MVEHLATIQNKGGVAPALVGYDPDWRRQEK